MRLMIAGCLLLISAFTFAEQKQVFGDYEVHYIGLTSSELDKDVAKLYGIPRSRNIGFLNLSVLKTGIGELPVAWNAKLEGTMSNLIGQSKELSFTRVQETSALYFYSTFDFYSEDMYRFHIKVTPEGSKRSFDVKFSQRFYRGE
ncbi:hypothetical protein NBRC116188_13690 [Oceaniserpentilla sp. 4NH20-0058]|uniref:DUF4426 domain-containing protein n=1 Tax=Oceaniserpentilla sp. 4NH20-0058 TaxID=3127660 RepID=UPI00310862A0